MALGNGSAEGGNMGGQGVNQLKPIFSRHMEPRAAYRQKSLQQQNIPWESFEFSQVAATLTECHKYGDCLAENLCNYRAAIMPKSRWVTHSLLKSADGGIG